MVCGRCPPKKRNHLVYLAFNVYSVYYILSELLIGKSNLLHQYIDKNRINQTTSTKCQYHAAASKDK